MTQVQVFPVPPSPDAVSVFLFQGNCCASFFGSAKTTILSAMYFAFIVAYSLFKLESAFDNGDICLSDVSDQLGENPDLPKSKCL